MLASGGELACEFSMEAGRDVVIREDIECNGGSLISASGGEFDLEAGRNLILQGSGPDGTADTRLSATGGSALGYYYVYPGSGGRTFMEAPQIDALVKRGMLTADEAEHHPGRHTLREAVMGQPLSLIDKGNRKLGPDVKLLLCSDGVQSLSEAEIAANAIKPVDGLVKAVLAAAKEHQDNITVIKLERAR